MAKISKINGSVIVASLLFSMTGCGDDNKSSSDNIPKTNTTVVADDISQKTKEEKLKESLASTNNFLSREIAKDEANIDLGTILATLLNKNTQSDASKITTAKAFILDSSETPEDKATPTKKPTK